MYLTRDTINKTGLLNEELFPMWGCTAEYQLRVARNNIKILALIEIDDFIHVREGGFGESFKQLFKEEPSKKNLFVQTPPLVSVVIPTHNFSSWLPSAINSLIGGDTDLGYFEQQTFASFEVIIVDDSSTDDTPQIIESLVDGWKGVRTIRLDRPREKVWDENEDKYIGKTVAMNAGIDSAYGTYILSADADDMMETDRIEKLFNHISKNPTSVVYDDMRTFTDGERTKEWRVGAQPNTGIFYDEGQFDFTTCLYKNQVHFSTMFAKNTWQKVGGYCERMLYGREDWHFAINCASNGFIPHKIKYAGMLYRRDGQNRTLVNAKPDWMTRFQKQMRGEFPDLYRETPRPKQGSVWF